jgi:glycine/D-amino acid oxidase-like deaminating enzyme
VYERNDRRFALEHSIVWSDAAFADRRLRSAALYAKQLAGARDDQTRERINKALFGPALAAEAKQNRDCHRENDWRRRRDLNPGYRF